MDRTNFHAGITHVHNEHRDARVLGSIRIGSGKNNAIVRQVGQGGPHLLTINDPFVTIALGFGLQARHIRTSTRL